MFSLNSLIPFVSHAWRTLNSSSYSSCTFFRSSYVEMSLRAGKELRLNCNVTKFVSFSPELLRSSPGSSLPAGVHNGLLLLVNVLVNQLTSALSYRSHLRTEVENQSC